MEQCLVDTSSVQVPLCLVAASCGGDVMLLWEWWFRVRLLRYGEKLLACVRAHGLRFPALRFDVWFLWVWKGHAEESFGTADKFIHIALSGDLLHDSLLVVVAKRSTKLVIIHRWTVLLNAPSSGHLLGIDKFELHSTPCPRDKRGTFGFV